MSLGPQPRLGYTASRIDRAATRRGDALAALDQDTHARAYAIGGEMVVLRKTAGGLDPLFAPPMARLLANGADIAFLGLHEGAARYAVAVDANAIETLKTDERFTVVDLRSIATRGLLDAEHLPPLAEGKALLNWHARHRFCSNCGATTTSVEGGWRRDCAGCKTPHFPRTDPVAIMLAVAGDKCLLGRSHRFQPGMWSCLAGFIEPGETIEDAVRREIHEEAGISCGRVTYFASQPWPFPTSLMIGCHAEAISHDITVDRTELADARWFDRGEVTLMLERQHPDGLSAPQPVAIAYHIIRSWVENCIEFR
jgi:NAD+ diphosphatase